MMFVDRCVVVAMMAVAGWFLLICPLWRLLCR